MNYIFQNHLWKFVTVYMDDTHIFSKSFNEHLMHIEKMFVIIKEHGLKMQPSKTSICKRTIEFLGFQFQDNKISIPQKQKIKIFEYKEPTTMKELRSFSGYCRFFRKFIKNYTEIMTPLHEALKRQRKTIILDYTQKEA